MKMNKKTIGALLLIGIIATIQLGCTKYDEGGLTANAEKNLKNSWKLEKYLRNGNDETSSLLISNYLEEYQEEGIYLRSYIDKQGDPVNESGNWQFDNKRQQVNISGISSFELTEENSTVSSSDYNIVKLKNKEYRYNFVNGGDTHEFWFVPN